jgi:CRISPR-associated protein Cmr4
MSEPFVKKTYYAMTLDPVQIGTGGYRLGRVDNTITREPGTNLPKIPGSSIAGVARAYTAMAIQNLVDIDKLIYKTKNGLLAINESEYKNMKYLRPKYNFNASNDPDNPKNRIVKTIDVKNPSIEKDNNNKDIFYSCAGKGAEDGDGHCGRHDCEVCVPFGFSRKSGNSFQGLAQFYDARIFFFPVYSMIGPVWVTCPFIMNDLCETLKTQNIKVEFNDRLGDSEDEIQTDLVVSGSDLNLGWLLLKNKEKVKPINQTIPKINQEIINRLVLVSDKLFSRIVNDNLEVRTSVAIDPATGAAEEGALYTYEAIPRATVMWFDVIYNRPEYFRINGQEIMKDSTQKADADWIRHNVEKGFAYFEAIGVGGMGTRGMGRLKVLNLGG